MSTTARRIIKELGSEWRGEITPADKHDGLGARMFDRPTQLINKATFIENYLGEFTAGGKRVLDIACGAGAFLECMRFFGNEVMGTDLRRFSFLESQGIPYVQLNCYDLPYPFEDNSYDLVSCMGLFGKFNPENAPDILNEFFRISSDTVMIKLNSLRFWDANAELFNKSHPDWKRVGAERATTVKFKRVG